MMGLQYSPCIVHRMNHYDADRNTSKRLWTTPGSSSAALDTEAAQTTAEPNTSIDEPSRAEPKLDVPYWSSSTAALRGPMVYIPSELLKCAINPVANALYSLFTQVWRSGRIPLTGETVYWLPSWSVWIIGR